MMRTTLLLSLLIGLAIAFISGNVFAVRTPIVLPDENAIFYPGEPEEQTAQVQGWASIARGVEDRLEVAVTASGLVSDCKYGVRLIDPSTGKREVLGALITDEEGKGVFSKEVLPDHLRDWKVVEIYTDKSCAGSVVQGKSILSFVLEETGERS